MPRRLAGCLIGQCLGDALGFPMEGEGAPDCQRWVREVVRTGRPGRGREGYAFGQYSDGSQMARELLLAWREAGTFDAEVYARRIARLFAEDRAVGRGRTTTEAAERLIAGVPWEQAGTPPPSAGNAGAVRAAPLGILCRDDPLRMLFRAQTQCRITHADPRCMAGAVAVAGAVLLAARATPIEPGAFLAQLREWAGSVEVTFASALRRLEGWLELPPERAAPLVAAEGCPPGVDSQWHGGISAFVVGSVLWALYAFLRNPGDYVACVSTAIEPGGDVDTTAAMAGAISGAHLGLEVLPLAQARRLTDRGEWGFDELVALAESSL